MGKPQVIINDERKTVEKYDRDLILRTLINNFSNGNKQVTNYYPEKRIKVIEDVDRNGYITKTREEEYFDEFDDFNEI